MPSQDKVPGEAGGAILVTGGSSGVGLGCTRHLAAAGLPVIVACRDLEGAAKAIGTITDETGNRDLRVVPLDLASLGSVRKLVQNLLQEGVRLRALVCNAGLQLAREIAFTEEGLELTFGVNHLGHFLLANLLIEHLVANAPTRILVVSSGVHDPALRTGMPNPDYTDFESLSRLGTPEEVPYSGRLAYVNSKLCNLFFAYELGRRLADRGLSTPDRPVTVNTFEPGLVPGSGLARDYSRVAQFIWYRILPVLTLFTSKVNTADDAGRALANLVLEPELERSSGKYFPSHTKFQQAPSSVESYDPEEARKLWETSVTLSGLSVGDSPLL